MSGGVRSRKRPRRHYNTRMPSAQPDCAGAALDAALTRRHLALACARCVVEIVPAIDSTNSELLRRARSGALPAEPALFCLLAAEHQQAGRGRLGRTWVAPAGAALTVSFARRFALDIGALGGLSLVCGLALLDALRAHGVDAQLKWPNDVLVADRKLAGILVEVHAEAPDRALAVIGIGINTTPVTRPAVTGTAGAPAALPPADMTSLRQASGQRDPVDRNRLLADLAVALGQALEQFAADGFAPFVEAWNAAHAWRNRMVEVRSGEDSVLAGTARGVDAEGRLCIDTPTGLRTVIAGEVSVRAARVGEAC